MVKKSSNFRSSRYGNDSDGDFEKGHVKLKEGKIFPEFQNNRMMAEMNTVEGTLASPDAINFFQFDGRDPMRFKEEDSSVCDLYMNTLINSKLQRHSVKKKEFDRITMKERIKLRHTKHFKVTPDLMNWIFEHRMMGPKYYKESIVEALEKGKGTPAENRPLYYKYELDDCLPCFDNMFIEFPNCPWLCKDYSKSSGYPVVGFHIFPKENADMVYYFRRIYFDNEKMLYQLPSLMRVDYLSEDNGWMVKDPLWTSITNKETVDAFWKNPASAEKMSQFKNIYHQEIILCLQVLEVLNYDWIEPRKVERKKGGDKRSFNGFKKGDSFETMEVGLPKERGHQIRDQVFVDGVGIPKRRHEVRGHIRRYKNGMKVWVKSHERGDLSMGRVHKEYVLKKAG